MVSGVLMAGQRRREERRRRARYFVLHTTRNREHTAAALAKQPPLPPHPHPPTMDIAAEDATLAPTPADAASARAWLAEFGARAPAAAALFNILGPSAGVSFEGGGGCGQGLGRVRGLPRWGKAGGGGAARGT